MESVPTKNTIQNLTQLYIASLNEKEQKGLQIAQNHLGSAFSLEKSVGFLDYCAEAKKCEGASMVSSSSSNGSIEKS